MEESKLKLVSSYSGVGVRSKLEFKIFLDAGRELTDSDKSAIRKATSDIEKSICQETYRLDDIFKKSGDEHNQLLRDLFKDYAPIYVETVENEYSKDDCHSHWFVITTIKGRIKIGWRKRVINIDWSGSSIDKKADELFASEDVTKGDKYIHAWGYEKAAQYIYKLMQ